MFEDLAFFKLFMAKFALFNFSGSGNPDSNKAEKMRQCSNQTKADYGHSVCSNCGQKRKKC
jgi:hypothetical protein